LVRPVHRQRLPARPVIRAVLHGVGQCVSVRIAPGPGDADSAGGEVLSAVGRRQRERRRGGAGGERGQHSAIVGEKQRVDGRIGIERDNEISGQARVRVVGPFEDAGLERKLNRLEHGAHVVERLKYEVRARRLRGRRVGRRQRQARQELGSSRDKIHIAPHYQITFAPAGRPRSLRTRPYGSFHIFRQWRAADSQHRSRRTKDVDDVLEQRLVSEGGGPEVLGIETGRAAIAHQIEIIIPVGRSAVRGRHNGFQGVPQCERVPAIDQGVIAAGQGTEGRRSRGVGIAVEGLVQRVHRGDRG
jgi:hypothetical protein